MDDASRDDLIVRIGAFVGDHVSYVDAEKNDLGKPPQEYFRAIAEQLFILPDWLALLVINSDIRFRIIREDENVPPDAERAELDGESGTISIKSGSLMCGTVNSILLHEICHASDWILQQYSRKSTDPESPRRDGTTFFSLLDSAFLMK